MRNILFFQLLVAAHSFSLDSLSGDLYDKLSSLFSEKPENAEPNQLDYSEIFNDVTTNKQDELANIIKAIEEDSETFFADFLTTITTTFTGKVLNSEPLKQFLKRHKHVVWRSDC